MTIELKFPELGGGPVQGLNDAGVENFEGNIDFYLSRECGQNSGDARASQNQVVELSFEMMKMSPSAIPAFDQLRDVLARCFDRWGEKEKEREFFRKAIEEAESDHIQVLRIRDTGTTGLTGNDNEEAGRWFALVKSQGVSNKGDIAGGSFGIGKSSPFAASRFRTVFYGTRTSLGEVAFQGVSRLVTHTHVGGKSTQGTGFIGLYSPGMADSPDPIFRAVRTIDAIPEAFRRDEVGTDIWVIGYRSGDEWKENLVRSLLSNFWPAIHTNAIRFRVADQEITSETLLPLMRSRSNDPEFQAYQYYQAILTEPIKKTLNHVGECELYLYSESGDLPRKVCMARASGMRIYDYAPRACRVPFSALFLCKDHEGNKLLRKLEPPRHDTWDPKRLEDDSGTKALAEIKKWIRDEVKKLNPAFTGSSFEENEIAKYIPDSDPQVESLDSDANEPNDEESLEPRPRVDGEPRSIVVPVRPAGRRSRRGTRGGRGSSHGGRGDGTGGGDGEPRSGDDAAPGGGGGTRGSSGRDRSEGPPVLRTRSFLLPDGSYELVLRCDRHAAGRIQLSAVGEDDAGSAVKLKSAMLLDPVPTPLGFAEGVLQEVQIHAGAPLRISVRLEDVEKRSLNAELVP